MSAETDAYYGKDEPSATYKWGVAVPHANVGPDSPQAVWKVVAWFKTRERATTYARNGWKHFAIARANL